METKPVEKKDVGIVMPAVTPEVAIMAFNDYQNLAKKIITKEDIQNIQGKEFKKKSFWRKCQRFFNLSITIVDEKREQMTGYFMYKFTVRATAPNGTCMDATGACSSNEKGMEKTEHNTRAIAETRAKNRAIADLVAFGEVSAEEIQVEEVRSDPTEKWVNQHEEVKPVQEKHDAVDDKCNECGSTITSQKVIDYAKQKYGKVLCYKCQKKVS